jgi:hypothetical protein
MFMQRKCGACWLTHAGVSDAQAQFSAVPMAEWSRLHLMSARAGMSVMYTVWCIDRSCACATATAVHDINDNDSSCAHACCTASLCSEAVLCSPICRTQQHHHCAMVAA